MSTIFLKTIKKRVDFLKVSKSGKKIFTKGFILQKYKRTMDSKNDSIRIGFTITKKIGGAVIRNKIKRRFRTIIREIFSKYLRNSCNYNMCFKIKYFREIIFLNIKYYPP